MAVSISYSKKKFTREQWHRSAAIGSNPYQDWIRFNRPSKAAFKYTDHRMDDIITVIYDPNLDAMYIDVTSDYWYMTAVARVQVDNDHKRLRITSATCNAADNWPLMNGPGCPNGHGGARFLRRALDYASSLDALGIASREFFGPEWSFVTPIKRGTIFDSFIINSMHEWDEVLNYNRGPWGKCTAFFDLTRVQASAATKIQAAFRGWKARMKYRYNPYTSLGRYVILHEAGFL